ncbi:conjugal transfer protein TraQ [Cronobacter turicensis]|nr:conjugal transfer protein TraQ [Klebsiella pneumoniae]
MNDGIEKAIIEFANGGREPLIRLILVVALISGLIGCAAFLIRATKTARHSTAGAGMGRIAAGFLFCLFLICLKQMMNAGAHSIGLGDVSFDGVNYASTGTFGLGAQVVNAIMSILRIVGAYLFYKGVKNLKNSQLEGNTELSASGAIGKGIVQCICGLIFLFNPEILDRFQASINIHW